MATTLSFSKFTELFLARLYDADRERPGGGEFFDGYELVSDLREDFPEAWVSDAADLLMKRGLVHAALSFGSPPGVGVLLEPEGRLFVEQEKGSGVIREYHDNPSTFVINIGDHNQYAIGTQGDVAQTLTHEQHTEVLPLLDRLEEEIKAADLSAEQRDELEQDLTTVRGHLARSKPNMAVVVPVLKGMQAFAAIAATVTEILRALGHG